MSDPTKAPPTVARLAPGLVGSSEPSLSPSADGPRVSHAQGVGWRHSAQPIPSRLARSPLDPDGPGDGQAPPTGGPSPSEPPGAPASAHAGTISLADLAGPLAGEDANPFFPPDPVRTPDNARQAMSYPFSLDAPDGTPETVGQGTADPLTEGASGGGNPKWGTVRYLLRLLADAGIIDEASAVRPGVDLDAPLPGFVPPVASPSVMTSGTADWLAKIRARVERVMAGMEDRDAERLGADLPTVGAAPPSEALPGSSRQLARVYLDSADRLDLELASPERRGVALARLGLPADCVLVSYRRDEDRSSDVATLQSAEFPASPPWCVVADARSLGWGPGGGVVSPPALKAGPMGVPWSSLPVFVISEAVTDPRVVEAMRVIGQSPEPFADPSAVGAFP